MHKRIEYKILLRITLLFITLFSVAFLLIFKQWVYAVVLAPLVFYQLYDMYHFHRSAINELNNFLASVKYKDFSRRFDVKHAPAELQILREGFNDINDAFKIITKEKETQYHYLQKILEMVNTGILSYDVAGGEVIWMNESLKQMLQLPYLRTIHSLQKRDVQMYEDIVSLRPGEGKITDAHPERGTFKVLISATSFNTEGKEYKLIAFQNINEAVDETEANAWKKLLSVMTHEIMNSVAPISSLAATLTTRLEESRSKWTDNAAVSDLYVGIETIKRRSESLLKFAETYRNLNKITKPDLQSILVRDLFENIYNLMEPSLDQKKIEMDIVLKETQLSVEVDVALIEQVLINLVINAIDAVKEKEEPQIILSAGENSQRRKFIKVADNGSGMDEDVLEKIFVPFFSTKKTGSGIGLSLCKQIMLVHHGNITVQSVPGQGTVFTLQF